MPTPPTTSAIWGVEDWSETLITALSLQSAVLRAGASRYLSEGRVLHVPRLKVNPAASWTAELATITSDAGDADTLVFTPKKLADVATLSTESVEDASVDELDQFGQALVRGVGIALDAKFFSNAAATSTAPAGLLHYTLPGTGAGGTVDIDGILDGIGAILGHGGNADTVFLAPDDITAIRKQKTTQGAYLLAPDGASLQAAGAERVGGAQLIPTAGLTAGTAVVCQSSFIALAIRRDASVDFSTDRAFLEDGVVARVTMRMDYAPSDPNAFWVISP